MKLKVGSVILIHGWVMLAGLEDGKKYRVQSIPDYYGTPTYQFTKAKGKKVMARHYITSVDLMIDNSTDLNRIEIL